MSTKLILLGRVFDLLALLTGATEHTIIERNAAYARYLNHPAPIVSTEIE